MNIRKFVKNHPMIDKIRFLEEERLLLIGLDESGEYHVADGRKHVKGQKLAVQYSSEALLRAHEKMQYRKYFLVHNHPVLGDSSNHCHYFSQADISFYDRIKNGLEGTGVELVDFYVVSERGEYSMEDFLQIL